MILLMSLPVACMRSAYVGTSSFTSIPPDAVATCASSCKRVDLQLQSIVIMASQIGCVCNVAPSPDH
jgi:hypothetical protein